MVGLPQVSHTLGCQTMDAVPHLPWLTCTSSSINGQPSLCKSMEAEPPIPYCPPPLSSWSGQETVALYNG